MKLATILLLLAISCVVISFTDARRRSHDEAAEKAKCKTNCGKTKGNVGVYWSDSIQKTSGCKCVKAANEGKTMCDMTCRIRSSNTKTTLVAQFSGTATNSQCKCVKPKRLFLQELSHILRDPKNEKKPAPKKVTVATNANACKTKCGKKVAHFTAATTGAKAHPSKCACTDKRRMFIQRGDNKTVKPKPKAKRPIAKHPVKPPTDQTSCNKTKKNPKEVCIFAKGQPKKGKKAATPNSCKCKVPPKKPVAKKAFFEVVNPTDLKSCQTHCTKAWKGKLKAHEKVTGAFNKKAKTCKCVKSKK